MTTLLCLDPGITTGYAWFFDAVLTTASTLSTYEELYEEFFTLLATDVVVCEDFTPPRMLPKDGKVTIEWLGIIKFLCYQMRLPLVLQRPQEKLPFRTEAKALLGEGIFTEHSIDAVGHGVRYLRKQQPQVEITSFMSEKL